MKKQQKKYVDQDIILHFFSSFSTPYISLALSKQKRISCSEELLTLRLFLFGS